MVKPHKYKSGTKDILEKPKTTYVYEPFERDEDKEIKTDFQKINGSYVSASEFVSDRLDGSDYERGSVETAQASSDNCVEFLGRLIGLLHEKKILTSKEIHKLVEGIY